MIYIFYGIKRKRLKFWCMIFIIIIKQFMCPLGRNENYAWLNYISNQNYSSNNIARIVFWMTIHLYSISSYISLNIVLSLSCFNLDIFSVRFIDIRQLISKFKVANLSCKSHLAQNIIICRTILVFTFVTLWIIMKFYWI